MPDDAQSNDARSNEAASNDLFAMPRAAMVRDQLRARGITDSRVLDVMARLPRHAFVPEANRGESYADRALPIDPEQTISQPYIVALMTQALMLRGDERVLEIGTGSGYQTAILCLLTREVFSIEQSRDLAESASQRLAQLGLHNARLFVGDGGYGIPDYAPYDAILCAAAAPAIPEPLRQQMSKTGGRMVLPVGDDHQQLLVKVDRSGDRWQTRRITGVRFVPLLGRFGQK